jgi:hypothetical protein
MDFIHSVIVLRGACGLRDVYPQTETDMYKTGSYKEIEVSHPIYPRLDHSDCDGEMGPDDCGQVGMYLKEIVKEWKGDGPEEQVHIDFGNKLADVMLKCFRDGNTLLFL